MTKSSDNLLGLKNGLWPIHLKPQPDELLSSWIIRLAHAHGYKVETFCTLLFGYRSTIWNRDIDILAPATVKNALIRATGITDSQFELTTVRAYEGSLFEEVNSQGINRWILSLGVHHRKRKRFGLMCCPQCFASDKHPYYRRIWRLAFSTVCLIHNCKLIDCCTNCGAPIAPHRTDMFNSGVFPDRYLIRKCWNCEFDLAYTPLKKESNSALLSLQESCESTLNQGYREWAGNKSMYSLVFFDGFHQLISGILKHESRKRLIKSHLSENFRISDWQPKMIEKSSFDYRYDVFSFCGWLLDDWPNNFISVIKKAKLRYSDLKGGYTSLAYWYECLIKNESWTGNPVFSNSEKDSIIDYIELKKGYYSNKMALSISGKDISKYVKEKRNYRVGDDLYDELLVSIDHKIAGTMDKYKKYCLIRDKIMFACGRIFNLTEGELSKLTIGDFPVLHNEAEPPDFYVNAKCKESVREWIGWYIANIRWRMSPRENCKYVFTSFYTKREMKKSIISSRFNDAVKMASLDRYIKSYGLWRR